MSRAATQELTRKNIYIGVTCYDQKGTFIGELIETFKKECASLDTDKYAISMTIMDAAGSQRAQDDQVQEMIEDGCNVLCINLADRTDLSHIINAAMEKDIPIIFFNREPVDEDLNRWAEKSPRKIFLVWRGEVLSYSEAYSRVCAIAASLSPWQGEVLGLRFSDPPSQVLYFLGAMMAGVVPVLLHEGTELCHPFLDVAGVRDYLRKIL